MPAYLFMDAKTGAGGTTCAVYRYVNGTPTQVGSTFGTNVVGSGPTLGATRNMVIQFQGELYAMAQDGVYKKDDPASMIGGWTIQISFTNPSSTRGAWSGLYPVEVGGQTQLVGTFIDNTGGGTGWRWVKFDGTTWTQAANAVTLTQTGGETIDVIVYRGLLHVIATHSAVAYAITFDPSTNSFGGITHPFATGQLLISLAISWDRLFAVYKTGSTARLAEFTGGVWNDVLLITTMAATAQTNTKWCLFSDQTTLYAFILFDLTSVGWKSFEISEVLGVTETTTPTIPASLRRSGDGGTFSGTADNPRVYVTYNIENFPPGTADIYFYFALDSTAGTSFAVYQWAGGGGIILTGPTDTGGNVAHSPPSGFPNAGERLWTAGELDVRIVGRAAILGGEQISFTAYGGGTGRKFKLYYGVEGTIEITEATLIGPVTGGAATLNTGLNQVEGVAADGVTVYTIVWDVQTDGFFSGDRTQRYPRIEA